MCFSTILEYIPLLISIRASSSIGSGFGRLILLHSAKSVTLLFLSSYSLLCGSKVCLVLASSSSSSLSSLSSFSFSVSIISRSGGSTSSCYFLLLSISSSSFFLCILTFANACSFSNSISFSFKYFITENFVCMHSTDFSSSDRDIPLLTINTSSSFIFTPLKFSLL